LKQEAFEVLSIETRHLDIKEVMFLRLRNLIRKDDDLNYKLNKGYDRDQEQRSQSIHVTDI
jgi:hypothetical protein